MRANDLKELFDLQCNLMGVRWIVSGLLLVISGNQPRDRQIKRVCHLLAFLLLALGLEADFLEREALWRRGRKSGARGLQASSVT